MNIRKSTLLLSLAVILMISSSSCKKSSKEDIKLNQEELNNKNKLERLELLNRICAYPYWTTTTVTADNPVDIYKKGATTDIFSQRPKHQSDYYIEVKLDPPHVVDYVLHFNAKTIQGIKKDLAGDGWTTREIDEEFETRKDRYFQLGIDESLNRTLEWIRPFSLYKKRAYGNQYYRIESIQENILKLYYFDKELSTTIRVTFTGSKTIPQ
jgi:hypothetical protein